MAEVTPLLAFVFTHVWARFVALLLVVLSPFILSAALMAAVVWVDSKRKT